MDIDLRRLETRVPAWGGMPARRAILRWASRMFRREWRQQTLVLMLLTVAVALLIAGTTTVYNITSPKTGQFGNADYFVKYVGLDPRGLETEIDALGKAFGVIEVVSHWEGPIPGSVDRVDLRDQDPDGVFGAPMLQLQEGRYPTKAGELAITDEVATTFQVSSGDVLVLGGREWDVVGEVENPGDLDEEFALLSEPPDSTPASVTVFFNASREEVDAFITSSGSPAEIGERGPDDRTLSTAIVLELGTVFLLFVCLVAAAGFAVIGQRRLRHLGMLGALGATERNVRLVLASNGALVGLAAAIVGSILGLATWIAVAQSLETAAAHRIERFDLPWPFIVIGFLLAVATATVAASWPGRAMARVSIVGALSARPPRPKPTHRSAVFAALFMIAGVMMLVLSNRERIAFIIAGTLSTAIGVLLTSPFAIRVLARTASRSRITWRLAVRDLARYQARSGAALAAISLALGIAMTIALATTSAKDDATEGNLPADQMIIRLTDDPEEPIVPERTTDELAYLRPQIDRIIATLDGASATGLEMAFDPAAPLAQSAGGEAGRLVVWIGKATEQAGGGVHVSGSDTLPLFVATPSLLDHLGIRLEDIAEGADILTPRADLDGYEFIPPKRRNAEPPTIQTMSLPLYASFPTSLITPEALQRNGWSTMPVAWLVDASEPITDAQIDAAREIAADAGVAIEARDQQATLLNLRAGALAGGALLALGVLAMTVGLIRAETSGDLRTLTAAGASSTTRRSLAAATTGALALMGVLIGTVGAYVAFIAWYHDDLEALSRAPALHLAVVTIGLPVAAAVSGWLLAGREPAVIARRAIE